MCVCGGVLESPITSAAFYKTRRMQISFEADGKLLLCTSCDPAGGGARKGKALEQDAEKRSERSVPLFFGGGELGGGGRGWRRPGDVNGSLPPAQPGPRRTPQRWLQRAGPVRRPQKPTRPREQVSLLAASGTVVADSH